MRLRSGKNALFSSLALWGLMLSSPAMPADAPSKPPPDTALWSKQCGAGADGKQQICVVQQFVTAMPQNQVLLATQFGYLGQNFKPRLILTAPLGILLPPGLTLSIDGKKPLSVPLEHCRQDGCRAIIEMDAPALDQFRNGKVLNVRYVTGDGKAQDLPVKLTGLADALKSLSK